jgi:hypothetical protein
MNSNQARPAVLSRFTMFKVDGKRGSDDPPMADGQRTNSGEMTGFKDGGMLAGP